MFNEREKEFDGKSEFFGKSDLDSQIYKYFRTLNRIIPKHQILVDRFGNKDVFISVTNSSFFIFDLEKFDILFTVPFIPEIGTYGFFQDTLFISCGKKLLKFRRASCVGSTEFQRDIHQILCVGDFEFVVDSAGILYVGKDQSEMSQTPCRLIHHPFSYLNKLVVVLEDSVILYNFIKKKEIYKFKSLNPGICLMVDSKVIDVVGVGYPDGKVEIVNLKKDKVLFSFKVKSKPTEIDFSSDRLLIVTDSVLHLYDLNEKRLLLKKPNTLSCKFVDDTHLLHNSSSCISLLEIHTNKLEPIKVKHSCTGDIIGLEEMEDNNFIVLTKSEVYKYNTGNTSTYQKFKFNGSVEKFSLRNGMGALYGDRILHKLGSSIKQVLSTEVALLSSYKNICAMVVDDIVFVNLDSQKVYLTIKADLPIKDIKMDRENLYVLSGDKLHVLPYRNSPIVKSVSEGMSFHVGDFKEIFLFDSLILLKSETSLALFVEGRIFRTFSIPNVRDCSISPDLKWLAVNDSTCIFILDILSGNLIDTIPCASKFIRFSPDMLFLIVVDLHNQIILFNNKLMFNPRKPVQEKTGYQDFLRINKEGFLKASKKNQKLYNEILLQKTLRDSLTVEELFQEDRWVQMLSQEDLMRILNLLVDNLNLNSDFDQQIMLINKLLKMRHKDLKHEEIEEIQKKYLEAFRGFEGNYLKSVGYLELEKEKLIN